jgi:hypothetical protein
MSDIIATDRAATIAQLNDLLRTTGHGGRVMVTQGVSALPSDQLFALMGAIQQFDAFTADNDPYGEHDFGSVQIDGETYFFKIDYYDPDLVQGSSDPADPAVTARVMTVMLAEEY